MIEVGPDGSGAAPRAMTLEEYRIIAEQLVLGLLDAGIDVGEWKHGPTPSCPTFGARIKGRAPPPFPVTPAAQWVVGWRYGGQR